MNIQEKIATFMGTKYSDDAKWHLPQHIYYNKEIRSEIEYFDTHELKYDSLWNWLMPVVNEIDSQIFGTLVTKKYNEYESIEDQDTLSMHDKIIKVLEDNKNATWHNGRLLISPNINEAYAFVELYLNAIYP